MILTASLLYSCGNSYPPDFSKKGKIIGKMTNSEDISMYALSYKIGSHTFRREFKAPYAFANMGDIVSYHQGVIKVVEEAGQ